MESRPIPLLPKEDKGLEVRETQARSLAPFDAQFSRNFAFHIGD